MRIEMPGHINRKPMLPQDQYRFTLDEIRAYIPNENFLVEHFDCLGQSSKRSGDGAYIFERAGVERVLGLWMTKRKCSKT